MDTHYLPELRDRLARDLQSNGYWDEAREAFAELNDLPAAEHTFDPEGYWRIGKARGLSRRTMALVRELYLLREDFARGRDQPPFKIFNDSTLVALATHAPKDIEALREVRGMTNGQVYRYGKAILQALRRGEGGKFPSPPKNNRPPNPDVLARYDALRTWRRDRGAARGVDSDIILSRDALWELAHQAPRTKEDLKTIDSMGPWKRRTYGEEILQVLRKVTH
jgi:ribonuclease D